MRSTSRIYNLFSLMFRPICRPVLAGSRQRAHHRVLRVQQQVVPDGGTRANSQRELLDEGEAKGKDYLRLAGEGEKGRRACVRACLPACVALGRVHSCSCRGRQEQAEPKTMGIYRTIGLRYNTMGISYHTYIRPVRALRHADAHQLGRDRYLEKGKVPSTRIQVCMYVLLPRYTLSFYWPTPPHS